MRNSYFRPFVPVFILLTTTSCNSVLMNSENTSLQEQTIYASVCEINVCKSLSDGEFVSVQGNIVGYHELVLFSDECSDSVNLLELQLTEEEKTRLLEVSSPYRQNSPDVTGEIKVHGRFFRGAGLLYTYPPRRINLEQPLGEIHGLVVNKIIDAKVVEFIPR